ncbi:MAG: hypothetical protein V3S98_03020 [Dehalococcoidia bacterium]
MFEQADISLIEIRLKLDMLRTTTDPKLFVRSFMDLLEAAGKGFGSILRSDRGRLPKEFADWLEARREETESDELLKLALEPRDSFTESGENPLLIALEIGPLSVDDEAPDRMPEGWWTSPGDTERFHAMLSRRPLSYRGEALPQNDPVSVCSIVNHYLSDLTDEAQARLGTAARADHSLLNTE